MGTHPWLAADWRRAVPDRTAAAVCRSRLGNAKAVTELAQAQIVVQLGASLTGKRLLQWQATCSPEEYWLVDPLEGRLDPAHHRGRRLVSDIDVRWRPPGGKAPCGPLRSRRCQASGGS